jgi:hypothetical protein
MGGVIGPLLRAAIDQPLAGEDCVSLVEAAQFADDLIGT